MKTSLRLLPQLTIAVSTRGARGRPPPSSKQETAKPKNSSNNPADFLKDATTFGDVHSVVLDPYSSLPYPAEQLEDHLVDTERQRLRVMKDRERFQSRKLEQLNFDHIPIEDQIVALFPGQGAQFVGMGSKVIDNPEAAAVFQKASEILQYDLLDLCLKGPSSKLNQTMFCQPAVFVASLAAFEKLKSEQPDFIDRLTDAAGFSVGEYAALVAADVLSFEDALRIVRIRAEAMHECNQRVSAGMLTVRVNAKSRLEDAMKEAAEESAPEGIPVCQVANYLYCGVKVVGGSVAALDFLETNAKRFNFVAVKRLAVSGAFHTALMQPAGQPIAAVLKEATLKPARCNVYSNWSGKVYPRKASDIRRGLINQLASPVKWEQIQQILYRKHIDYQFPSFIEIGPGKQLGAMLVNVSKKAYKSYKHYSC